MTIRTHFLLYVSCAIEYNNTLLLIKRPINKPNAGLLAFPGGAVEPVDGALDTLGARSNDILRTAIKREIMEEVGLVLEDPIEYVTGPYHIGQDGNHVIGVIFYHKFKHIPIITACPIEVPEYYWMSDTEINNAPNAPTWVKKQVELIQNLR